MSYDLAVWEGTRPSDDAAAGETFERLYGEYVDIDEIPPTPAIRAYVDALLGRWPESTDANGPWADSPLIGNARGPLFHFALTYSRADEVVPVAARLAAEHGLVCFDPQSERLRLAGTPAALVLSAADDSRVSDPSPDDIEATVRSLTVDNWFAILERDEGTFLQVAVKPGWFALEVREGTPESHVATRVTTIDEATAAFHAYARSDETWTAAHTWAPVEL